MCPLPAGACKHLRERWSAVGAEQCHSVPSLHAGEGQGGGYNMHCICFISTMQLAVIREFVQGDLPCPLSPTPLPVPPPHGGRGPCGTRRRSSRNVLAAD